MPLMPLLELASEIAALRPGDTARRHYVLLGRCFPATHIGEQFRMAVEAFPDCYVRSDHASFDVLFTKRTPNDSD